MKNIAYSIVGFTIILLSVSSSFLFPDSEYKNCSGQPTGSNVNLNYTANFKNCEITFFDVWKDVQNLKEFLFSNDGGDSWITAKPGIPVQQNGVSHCEIMIKETDDNLKTYKIKKSVKCNCGPCIPSNIEQYQIITDFVSNPTNAYLSFKNCCCQEYTFAIGGDEISSMLISLKLHVDYLNNIKYSISSVDDENKMIYLVRI